MSTFKPIQTFEDVPLPTSALEHDTFDLKRSLDVAKSANTAIEVAAFANHRGGTLLFGAREQNGRIGAFEPVDESQVSKWKEAISKAVTTRCRPMPRHETARIHYEGEAPRFLLAVNVFPQLNGIVGVRVTDVDALTEFFLERRVQNGEDRAKASQPARDEARCACGGYAGQSWVFPVRSGSDTHYVPPENLPMYMVPHIRRIVLLLAQINEEEEVVCTVIENNQVATRLFGGFDEEANVIKLRGDFEANSSHRREHWIPLDGVTYVYRDQKKKWRLVLRDKDAFFQRE